MQKNSPKVLNAWASYDWSNSVYNLVITTAIFPLYYTSVTKEYFGGDMVDFMGFSIENSVLYSYAISFAFMLVMCLSPLLSGVADYTGRKRFFMQLFTYLGSLSCIGLYFFEGSNLEYGMLCVVLASVGFSGALVFYNAFLPEIATKDRLDAVSARGFAMGYIGSVLLLVINLVLIMNPVVFGFKDGSDATRFGFLLVGFWWMGFAQIAFYFLRDGGSVKKITAEALKYGFKELSNVTKQMQRKTVMKRYLLSFFLYSMGVQTVMILAPLFAQKEAGIEGEEMILVVLIIQFLALAGAYTLVSLSKKLGNKGAISVVLLLWIAVCGLAYGMESKIGFYILAGIIGFGMGGIQSLSRSTYAKLVPSDTPDTASFFSFFDVTEKLAIVLGTFSYGFIDQMTGSMRNSMLCMALFFLVGFILLQRAAIPKVFEKDD